MATTMLGLVRVAEGGDLDGVIAALARRGAGENAVDRPDPRSGWTALTAAAHRGHRAVVLHLVDTAHATIDLVNRESGASALAYAAFGGHLAIVEDLVARGASVNGNSFPWTPLWCAGVKGHLDAALFLLEHGAPMHGGGGDGWTLLQAGAEGGHVRVVAYALDCVHAAARGAPPGKSAPPRYAAYHGQEEVIVPVSVGDAGVHKTLPLLHTAAIRGHAEVVRFLLQHDDVGDLTTRVLRYAALCLAAHHDHVDVVRELCAARRPPDDDTRVWHRVGPRVTAWLARTRDYSPFDLACDRGDIEAVRAFLRAPDAVDATAIAVAASRSDTYRDGQAVGGLLRDALGPWCPRVHGLRPAPFRAAVVPVLLACRRRGIPRDVALSHVVASCGRDWWRPASRGGAGGKGSGGGGRAATTVEGRSSFEWPLLLGACVCAVFCIIIIFICWGPRDLTSRLPGLGTDVLRLSTV